MVIGKGLIGSVFIDRYEDRDDVIIFASGVSSSIENDSLNFKKEKNLLINTLNKNKTKHIIYFSTFNDYNEKKSKYIKHKHNMEKLIMNFTNNYTIVRLPQVVGNGGNKNTMFNYFKEKINNNKEIEVYNNIHKGLIDVDDVKKFVDYILENIKDNNRIFEITYVEKMLVIDIVNFIALKSGNKPIIKLVKPPMIELPDLSKEIVNIFNNIGIVREGYTERVISKYIRNE